MFIMHIATVICLLLALMLSIDICSAKPTASSISRLDDNYYQPLARPLPSGYYFVENGVISSVSAAAVAADRRKDTQASGVRLAHYQPLVKYKQTRTKRKKLFVPNLFG